MPTYEFFCRKCEKPFERTLSFAEYDREMKKNMKCPNCGSAKVERQISAT
jgi:putative FmdB family regulatory protein